MVEALEVENGGQPRNWATRGTCAAGEDRTHIVKKALLANLLMWVGTGCAIPLSPLIMHELDAIPIECADEIQAFAVKQAEVDILSASVNASTAPTEAGNSSGANSSTAAPLSLLGGAPSAVTSAVPADSASTGTLLLRALRSGAHFGGVPGLLRSALWVMPRRRAAPRILVADPSETADVIAAHAVSEMETAKTEMEDCQHTKAGEFNGIFAACNAFCEFLTAGALGMFSDRFGRKPFMLFAALGMMLDLSALAYASGGATGGSGTIGLARGIAGLLGNKDIFTKTCIVDAAKPEDTVRYFGVIAMNLGLGIAVGAPAALILDHFVGRVAGLCFGLTSIALSMVVIMSMEEPLVPENRKKTLNWAAANPVGAMCFLFSSNFLGFFGVMSLVDQMAMALCFINLPIYCMTVFNALPWMFTLLTTYAGLCIGIVSVTVLPGAVKSLGYLGTVKAGYLLTTSSFVIVVIVTMIGNFWLMFGALSVFALGSISMPTQLSVASRCVSETEQGTLLGATGSLEVVGKMLGPITGAVVWRIFVPLEMPEALWWAGCGLMVPGVVISFALAKMLPPSVLSQLTREEQGLEQPACPDKMVRRSSIPTDLLPTPTATRSSKLNGAVARLSVVGVPRSSMDSRT